MPAVAQLLASLRYHNPAVEELFEPGHVALWDGAIAASGTDFATVDERISWYGWLVLGWAGLLVVRLGMALAG